MIYDCFTFYNEFEILELRLNILYNTVDHFVIVEANKTHTGKDKELFFKNNKDKFSKFMDKIIYIELTDLPPIEDSEESSDGNKWLYENLQRDAIMKGLKNCKPDDIIIISDCDEIPNPDIIKKYKKGVCNLLQYQLYYNYNTLLKDAAFSKSGKICRYSELLDPKIKISNKDEKYCKYSEYGKPTYLRFCRRGKTIKNAGWHFSYIGDEKFIYNKLQSIAEQQELNKFKDSGQNVEEQILKNIKNFENSNLNIKISNIYPKYFIENIDNYKTHISNQNLVSIHKAMFIVKIRKLLHIFKIV